MVFNCVVEKKREEFNPKLCRIEEVICLPQEEFEEFRTNMLDEYEFIKKYCKTDFTSHREGLSSILLMGTEKLDGILVIKDNESVALRTAFLPNIKELVSLKLLETVDIIINHGKYSSQDGVQRLLLEDIDKDYNFDIRCFRDEFLEELECTRVVEYADILEDEIVIKYIPQYFDSENESIEQNL